MTLIVNAFPYPLATHPGMKVGQMKQPASKRRSNRVACVQAEKVDAGNALDDDIGAHIHLGKLRKAGKRGNAAWTNVRHAKRGQAKPALSLKSIQFEHTRY